MSVTVATDANQVPTNRLTGGSDNNENQSGGFAGTSLNYDVANRVASVQINGQNSYYAYDTDNRRLYYRDTIGNETVYFYGIDGRKL